MPKKLLFIFCCMLHMHSIAQRYQIHGVVRDFATQSEIVDCIVRNVNTDSSVRTNAAGYFAMYVGKKDLLQFFHINHDTLAVRIENPRSPSYYAITMRQRTHKLDEFIVKEKNVAYKIDSLRTEETYKIILAKSDPSCYGASAAIMSSFSKKDMEAQEFRHNLVRWEQQKYIDSRFNAKQLERWTGLSGDSLSTFMQLYRPDYNYLRNVPEYTYLLYLKNSLAAYCSSCVFRKK